MTQRVCSWTQQDRRPVPSSPGAQTTYPMVVCICEVPNQQHNICVSMSTVREQQRQRIV